MCQVPRTQRFCLVGVTAVAACLAPGVGRSADQRVFGFAGDVGAEYGLPHPWTLLDNPNAGAPKFSVEEDDDLGPVLRLHAVKNQADGIRHVANVDLTETPYINFQWKVCLHPDGQVGTKRNDAAIRVQLDFGQRRFKRLVLSYVYDAKAERLSWCDDSSFIAKNGALVLDSGDEHLNEWVGRSRNVLDDYRKVYKSPRSVIQSVVVFADSNHSDSESIGYCGPISFSSEPLYASQSPAPASGDAE